MKQLHLQTRRRASRRRGRGWPALLSVLLAGGTALYLWNEEGRPELSLHQLSSWSSTSRNAGVPAPGEWEVYFSPDGGGTAAIVKEIHRAKKRIRVQAYSFTSAPIAKALTVAKGRGVDVRVILDKSQRTEKYTSATYLGHAGVPVLIDDSHAIAHDKVIILDSETVITGSFNFTKAAESRNSENLLILRQAEELVKKYEANWELHASHSIPYSAFPSP